jgi:hypothetical protein
MIFLFEERAFRLPIYNASVVPNKKYPVPMTGKTAAALLCHIS